MLKKRLNARELHIDSDAVVCHKRKADTQATPPLSPNEERVSPNEERGSMNDTTQ